MQPLATQSPQQLNEWHAEAIVNGGVTCEEPPGLRESGLYPAYLRDPAGNTLCAVHTPPA